MIDLLKTAGLVYCGLAVVALIGVSGLCYVARHSCTKHCRWCGRFWREDGQDPDNADAAWACEDLCNDCRRKHYTQT